MAARAFGVEEKRAVKIAGAFGAGDEDRFLGALQVVAKFAGRPAVFVGFKPAFLFLGVFHLAVPVESGNVFAPIVMEINRRDALIRAQDGDAAAQLGLELDGGIFLVERMEASSRQERPDDELGARAFAAQ